MYSEARKLRLTEKILNVKNEKTLKELESILKIKEKKKKKSPNIYDFVGILSEDEASEMKEAIAGTCKTKDDFIEYLLNGPVYSDKDIRIIEENRKSIAAWRIAN